MPEPVAARGAGDGQRPVHGSAVRTCNRAAPAPQKSASRRVKFLSQVQQ